MSDEPTGPARAHGEGPGTPEIGAGVRAAGGDIGCTGPDHDALPCALPDKGAGGAADVRAAAASTAVRTCGRRQLAAGLDDERLEPSEIS